MTRLDFRAEALPAMAFAVRHARRKFSPEEQARHKRDRMTIPAKEAERLGWRKIWRTKFSGT